MYAGHIGFALAAKGLRDSVPLWLLVFAAQLPDWADAGLCLAGFRTSTPGVYSHSWLAIAALASVVSVLYYVASRDVAALAILATVVVSHLVGDYVTGIKPTWPGGPMVGFGLYSYPVLDFIVETAIIIGGWLLYRRSFPEARRSALAVRLMPVVLILFQLGAVIAFTLSPPLRKC